MDGYIFIMLGGILFKKMKISLEKNFMHNCNSIYNNATYDSTLCFWLKEFFQFI